MMNSDDDHQKSVLHERVTGERNKMRVMANFEQGK